MVQIATRAIGIRHMIDLTDAKRWALDNANTPKERLDLGVVIGKISRVAVKVKPQEDGTVRTSYALEGLFRYQAMHDSSKAKAGDIIDATAYFVPEAFGLMMEMEMDAIRKEFPTENPAIALRISLSPKPESAVGYVINTDRLMAQIIDPFADIMRQASIAGVQGLPQIAAPVDAMAAMDAAHIKEAEVIEDTIAPEALAKAGEDLDEVDAQGPTVPKSSRKK